MVSIFLGNFLLPSSSFRRRLSVATGFGVTEPRDPSDTISFDLPEYLQQIVIDVKDDD